MEQVTTPVLLRADLTEAEYKELKIAAIRAGKSNAEFIGTILRDFLAEKGGDCA